MSVFSNSGNASYSLGTLIVNVPIKVFSELKEVKLNKNASKQNASVPTIAITKPKTPHPIPAAIEANMKTIFLGSLTVVLKRIIDNAPNIPNPLATLSPIACIIVAATMVINTNA